ncbi:MAG TPA: glucose-6-phosphate isomerase [Longimicrobiales bacterium]|nr:glucose-6-phosphate isomerase [Longimicrobiales bacterium]
MDRLTFDYGNMMAPRLSGRGIDPARLDAMADRFSGVVRQVERQREDGTLGFLSLPYETQLVDQIRKFADSPASLFEDVVVLGIGGSALGTIALRDALLPAGWNTLSADARNEEPRLHVLDNVDPRTIGPLLDRLDLSTALFDVVSKSGTTAETMSQFLIVRDRLRAVLPDEEAYRRHLVFTTDPDNGVLRDLARKEKIAALPVPPNVGGRYSVLSAVGLLPAALVGIDIEALLAGARAMDQRCRSDVLAENPAGLFAALQWLAHTEAGAPIHVMMAYGDALYSIADWFRQLWAESLGKQKDLDGADVFVGPTPVKALGTTDQHSQVQLYVEGPFDKTFTFLRLGEHTVDVPIPEIYGDIDALAYLGGHTLGQLLDAEQRATAAALARHGRMNMTIELPALTPHAVGELLMMLEIAAVYMGALYGIDPLNQPGVELGKRLTYGLMGRSGYEDTELPDADPRWISR